MFIPLKSHVVPSVKQQTVHFSGIWENLGSRFYLLTGWDLSTFVDFRVSSFANERLGLLDDVSLISTIRNFLIPLWKSSPVLQFPLQVSSKQTCPCGNAEFEIRNC